MSCLTDDEKCSECNEGWEQGKGLNCANNCEDKELEDKHRKVAKPMVDYCLPNWGVNVKIHDGEKPNDEYAWVTCYDKTININWWTLRDKEEFFDTIPHESAHISSQAIKFPSLLEQKIIKQYEELFWEKGEKDPETLWYRKKNKKLIKLWDSGDGKHWRRFWYPEYTRLHEELMKSSEFAKYNYSGSGYKSYKKATGRRYYGDNSF